MSYRLVTTRRAWNDALLTLPGGHILQSWEWGEAKLLHGWFPTRLLWEQDGQPLAAAQVLRRPLPRTSWGVLYVPKGPVLDYGRPPLLDRVLADLERYARDLHAILAKIDPDVEVRPSKDPAAAAAHPVTQALVARGWRFSAQQIQFRNTAILDLTPATDSLLAAMKSKTRYNIRLAQRRGVLVRSGTSQDIPRFYEMYAETGKRDGFLIRPFAYYRDTWQAFLDAGLAHMFLAEAGSSEAAAGPLDKAEAIAGLILFRFGNRAWYMYGASTDRHRDLMPNYALQWAAMLWAKEAGCTTYDLWGAPTTLDEHDQLWGVWRFKEGLGARFVPHIGAYDYPVSSFLYWVYGVAVPRYLSLLRRRRQTQLPI
jgi:lipid II:glycine glycyltransferase (peptidoglycan interpeptide bridge formation enzyme)